MALKVYEVPDTWVPDPTYINNVDNSVNYIEYFGWRLAVDKSTGTALWTFQQLVTTPTYVLSSLLPVGYVTYDLAADTPQYGFTRSLTPTTSISAVETYINDFSAIVRAEQP